jgi:hypothetical protein
MLGEPQETRWEHPRRYRLFVVALTLSSYTFDSRANRESPDAELCRYTPDGGKSCIKVG